MKGTTPRVDLCKHSTLVKEIGNGCMRTDMALVAYEGYLFGLVSLGQALAARNVQANVLE